jgi:hypothetical protein
MYPVNKPNQYNKPKQRERFSLKEGKYFWLSSIMKTFNKEQQAAWQEELAKREEEANKNSETTEEITNDHSN